jgi:hypothetical protein
MTLATELANATLIAANPGYHGMTYAVAASTINAASVATGRSISPSAGIIALMFQNTIDWAYMCDVAEGLVTSADIASSGTPVTVTTTIRRSARQMRDLLNLSTATVQFSTAQVTQFQTGVTFLQTSKVLSSAGAAALSALPAGTASGYTLFNTRPLDFNDIAQALGTAQGNPNATVP